MRYSLQFTRVVLLALSATALGLNNYSHTEPLQRSLSVFDDRPDDCPPCFNCQLDAFQCAQFAHCNKYNGQCVCPPGFNGQDCSVPQCGSLARGSDRPPRNDKYCTCDDGWGGINCNVCKTNNACNAMMPEGEGGVCYKQGITVNENFQMCDVTNRKILDQLQERKPQVTFTCKAEDDACNFQCMLFSVLFVVYIIRSSCFVNLARISLTDHYNSLGGSTGIILLFLGHMQLESRDRLLPQRDKVRL